jgi:hypothetical protein
MTIAQTLPDAHARYAERREQLVTQIADRCAADPRFVAGWLIGSLGREDGDAVSDIDLCLVVADAESADLCESMPSIRAGASLARLALIRRFGDPAVIHENHQNAPAGGAFVAVLYAESALVVDWTLIPASTAQRPPATKLLFDKIGIPDQPPTPSESEEVRAHKAAEQVAFFWMMAAVTAKYMIRRETVAVQWMLDMLYRTVAEIERLVHGDGWQFETQGSLAELQITPAAQMTAVRTLSDRVLALSPAVTALGGEIPAEPQATLAILLGMTGEDDKMRG